MGNGLVSAEKKEEKSLSKKSSAPNRFKTSGPSKFVQKFGSNKSIIETKTSSSKKGNI